MSKEKTSSEHRSQEFNYQVEGMVINSIRCCQEITEQIEVSVPLITGREIPQTAQHSSGHPQAGAPKGVSSSRELTADLHVEILKTYRTTNDSRFTESRSLCRFIPDVSLAKKIITPHGPTGFRGTGWQCSEWAHIAVSCIKGKFVQPEGKRQQLYFMQLESQEQLESQKLLRQEGLMWFSLSW